MSNNRFALALVSTLIPLGTIITSSARSPRFPEPQSHEVVFTIPVGDDGVHYEGVGVPEALKWGPAAFTIGPDGTFWIADTVGGAVLHYSSDGDLIGKLPFHTQASSITDIEVTTNQILVLDQASFPPRLLRLGLDGSFLDSLVLPPGQRIEDGLSGIALGTQGDVLIEREGGAHLARFLDSTGAVIEPPVSQLGYTLHAGTYSARPADLASGDPHRGWILARGRRIELSVSNDLGGLRILGATPSGSLFVIVEELAVSKALMVDQTIRQYGRDGELLGLARVPLNDQFTYVAQGVVLGPDDSIYALVTRSDRLEVQRLRFSTSLEPILAPNLSTTKESHSRAGEASALACVSRDTMVSTANSYTGNSKYLSSTNTDGTCAGREKPSYLAGAGTYSSVSYDWNGGDTVSAFNSYMSPGTYQAGDTNTSSEGCSRGVDCSGYVTRVWQIPPPTKYGTCTLENISAPLGSTSQLLQGDIMNKCSVHTVLFRSFGTNGMWGNESTTYVNYDRVVYGFSNWGRFTGYTPRRYTSVCP